MAKGATHPRAYRRVRARVFRRMPTRGGTPIMAYPGGHPRADRGVCVRKVSGWGDARVANLGRYPIAISAGASGKRGHC